MNQMVTKTQGTEVAPDDADLRTALSTSLYPGAKPESIEMVLSYCRAAGLNAMLKPVHIVPMNVKVGRNYEWRDVVMPGIGHYRMQASRSGEYLGKSEPVFGPLVKDTIGGVTVEFPEWCQITVKRKVGGHIAEFPALEYWRENFAGTKDGSPNSMWKKRPFGQLAKCCEAQALRMAFPELIGAHQTAEEMEGKQIGEDELRDITPQETPSKTETQAKRKKAAADQLDGFSNQKKEREAKARKEAEDVEELPSGEKMDPVTGEILPPEGAEGEEDENPRGLPLMPEEPAKKLKKGHWGAAWKWVEMTFPNVPADDRQAFADAHMDVLLSARKHNEQGQAAVDSLCENMGITLDDD